MMMNTCPHLLMMASGLWAMAPTFPGSGNIMDFVFTSEYNRVGDLDIIPSLPGCEHGPAVDAFVLTAEQLSLIVPIVNSDGSLRAWHKGHCESHLSLFNDNYWLVLSIRFA